MQTLFEQLGELLFIVRILVGLFLATLFIQSGLDKVFDWKGNLDWLKGHFSKTIFAQLVTPMLLKITVLENLAGFTSLIGTIYYIFSGERILAFYGAVLSAICILFLFIGQRIAKDYTGAATLANYFMLMILAVLLLG